MPKSKCNEVKIQVQIRHFYSKKKKLRHFHDSLLIKKKKKKTFLPKKAQDTLFFSIAWTGQKFFFLLVGLDWTEYSEPQIEECSKP